MPRALLSVFDKTGVVELAKGLYELGWDLLSSGGTAKAIAEAGMPVTDVADVTGYPAILGHRVVTLHPKVHGGILADIADPEHRADLEKHGIEPVALVVVNLYPFNSNPSIELIDVGGPAMVRAAAKNHAHVGVVVDPADYQRVVDAIRNNQFDLALRRELARKAFVTTAAYDVEVARWMTDEEEMPQTLTLVAEKSATLRYGENPHQAGARYTVSGAQSWWDKAEQLNGKEMSYLNVLDGEAAWQLVHKFVQPAAVIIKHANPCGVAFADSALDAYQSAFDADPVSAFGGIVAINREVDTNTANAISQVFTEVVIAPSYSAEALEVFRKKPALRVLVAPAPYNELPLSVRSIDGGVLVQTTDPVNEQRSSFEVVTKREPTAKEWEALDLAWKVCASVWSNAITLANDSVAVGLGGGQTNRVDAVRIAINRAGERASGSVCASDAFFPFRDSIDTLAAAGVTAVIQPGGSVRDAESIEAANEHGIAMVFTGTRHFRH
jgi:phosphoribosylaminoimidazolecarboxamide formyltransferase/IMP cyclohydrolase